MTQLVLAATQIDFPEDPVTELVLSHTSPFQEQDEEDVFGHRASGFDMDDQAAVSASAEQSQDSGAVVLPVLPVPDETAPLVHSPATQAPVRDLNLYLARSGVHAVFVERESFGIGWELQIQALGFTAIGHGSSKKVAKHNAAVAFLQHFATAAAK